MQRALHGEQVTHLPLGTPDWGRVKTAPAACRSPWQRSGHAAFNTSEMCAEAQPLRLRNKAASGRWHGGHPPKSDPDRLIGVVSLNEGGDNNRGFWIDPAWQGRGLATEASEAVTDFWFNHLGRDALRVPKAIANTASRRISEKQGMKVVQALKLPFVSGLHDAELWEIDADGWRRYRSAADHV